jgi:hypothetical protein
MLQKMTVGDRLINETQLARDLGISRPTLRTALDHYVRQGVIARRRGSGSWIVRHPKTRHEQPLLEIWTQAFIQKDPMSLAQWCTLQEYVLEFRLEAQERGPGSDLRAVELACGAMRVSDRPCLMSLPIAKLREQVPYRAIAELSHHQRVLPENNHVEPWAWKMASVGDRLYGVPNWCDTMVLWLRSEDLIAAQLDTSKPPRSWDELRQWLVTLHRLTGRRLALTPPSDGSNLLSLLAARSGAILEHDDEANPGHGDASDNLQQAVDWYASLAKADLLESRITFGRSAWNMVREQTLGYFHSILVRPIGSARHSVDEGFVPIPLPSRKGGIGNPYLLTMECFVINRRLSHAQRTAAMRYIHAATCQDTLRRRCQDQQIPFLFRRDLKQWAETPSWLESVMPAWQQILSQPLAAHSTPAGYHHDHLVDLMVRCQHGQQPSVTDYRRYQFGRPTP